MKPDVTVLMVVRNEENHVDRSIKSILDQTYRNYVFLITDDGSTDKTWERIQTFRDKRIIAKRFSDHQFLTKRLNFGLKQTKTKFIARMDSHNLADKTRLEKQRQFMLSHPETALVGCNYSKVNEAGETLFTSNFPVTWEEIRNGIMKKNPFKHAAWFARYAVLKDEGFYNEQFRYAQDYEFLLRLVPKYPVANLRDNLLTELVLPQSMSQKHRPKQAKFAFRAQCGAVARGDYPLWQAIYFFRTVGFYLKSLILRR